jgi:hypothetical protein
LCSSLSFPLLANKRWSANNVVLIGDALGTGHFSIGSGTRLAFDDAIALDRALDESGGDVPRLVAAFERERRPVVDKLVAAANASSFWYERMADEMVLSPVELAYDYMTRSGRMSDQRPAETAPRFMARLRNERARDPVWQSRAEGRIADPVADDAPGAREIGFAPPERYNASAILYDNLARRADSIAVLCGERRVTYRELCALADRVECGFTCSIWTNELATAHRIAMAVDAGYVWINEVGKHFLGAPFGGVKQSGFGREECLDEMLRFTQEKNIHVKLRRTGVLAPRPR